MMEKLVARGERIAEQARKQQLARVAQQLRGLFGGAPVSVEEDEAVVSGRSIWNRWLADPSLRFLAGGLK
jgi:hypothetical protein